MVEHYLLIDIFLGVLLLIKLGLGVDCDISGRRLFENIIFILQSEKAWVVVYFTRFHHIIGVDRMDL